MFNPNTVDELVPDRQVRREVGGVSDMTIWRWDHDPKMVELGWPRPCGSASGNSGSVSSSKRLRRTCCAKLSRDAP
jgi:hypothetical protein